MKTISRKLWYVLLMVVVICGMLLLMPGSLYATGHTLTVTVNKAIVGTGFTGFEFQLWRSDGHDGPELKDTDTLTGAGGTVILTWTDTSDHDADMYVVETGTGGATSTFWGFTSPASNSGNKTNDFTWDRDENMSKNVYFKNVRPAPPTYTVTYNGNANTGGTAPVDASSPYLSGALVTVLGNTGGLVKTGQVFSGWNTQENGLGTSYVAGNTFNMPAVNTTLFAQWTAEPAGPAAAAAGPAVYTITASTEGPGSITDPGSFNISQGADKIYSITPGDGASIVDVLVNGASVGAVSSYTFLGVNSSQIIHAIFSSGGVITVAGITEEAAVTETAAVLEVAGIQELPRTGNNMLFYVIGFALMAIGVAFGSFFIPKALRKRGN